MIPTSVRDAEQAIIDRHPMDALDIVDAAISELDSIDTSPGLSFAACRARTSLLEWRQSALDSFSEVLA